MVDCVGMLFEATVLQPAVKARFVGAKPKMMAYEGNVWNPTVGLDAASLICKTCQ